MATHNRTFRWLRAGARVLALLAATVGIVINVQYAWRLPAMQREQAALTREVGNLPIADPKKIWVLRLPEKEPLVWRWRVYIPPGQGVTYYRIGGLITADSPRSKYQSYGSSSSSARKQPREFVIALGLFKDDKGQWTVHTQRGSGRGRGSVDRRVAEALDAGRVTIDVRGKMEPVACDVQEPFFLLRVRDREQAEKLPDGETLYPGFSFYLVPDQAKPAFLKAMRGGP